MMEVLAITAACMAAVLLVLTRRIPTHRRQQIRGMLIERGSLDREAVTTLWRGDVPGGVGIISYPSGSLQAYYGRSRDLVRDAGAPDAGRRREYVLKWYGRNSHPVACDEFRTTDFGAFSQRLALWSSRGHVHRRDPFRAGPMMAI